MFGGNLLTGGGQGGLLQPMNKPQTQVDQAAQNGVHKKDLNSSLNQVARSIGE